MTITMTELGHDIGYMPGKAEAAQRGILPAGRDCFISQQRGSPRAAALRRVPAGPLDAGHPDRTATRFLAVRTNRVTYVDGIPAPS